MRGPTILALALALCGAGAVPPADTAGYPKDSGSCPATPSPEDAEKAAHKLLQMKKAVVHKLGGADEAEGKTREEHAAREEKGLARPGPQMNISSYQVCSDPKIWVFDDMLSEEFLEHVDEHCTPSNSKPFSWFNPKSKHKEPRERGTMGVYKLPKPEELVDVLVKLGGIDEVERCNTIMIADINKEYQQPHTDRIETVDLNTDFLDMDTMDFKTTERGTLKIVPSRSVVVNFNDYPGGLVFPHAKCDEGAASPTATKEGTRIDGKRGRIIMFENYFDNRVVNPRAKHFGTYTPDVIKRVFVGGMLSSRNPKLGSPREPGLLYSITSATNGHGHDGGYKD